MIIFVTSAHRTPLIDFGDLVTKEKGVLTGLGKCEAKQFGARLKNDIVSAYTSPVYRCVETLKHILEGASQNLPIQASCALSEMPNDLFDITPDGESAIDYASKYVNTKELSKGSGGVFELGELYYYNVIEGLDYAKLDELRTTDLNSTVKPASMELMQYQKSGLTICCVPELTLFTIAKRFTNKNVFLPHSLSYLQIDGGKAYYDGIRLTKD